MKIDAHVHDRTHSKCGSTEAREMVRTAIFYGLDALVFTNHHRFMQVDEMVELNKEFFPFRIYNGIEITVEGNEDFIVLGVDEETLGPCSWMSFNYPDLYRLVRNSNGFIAMAHPYRYEDVIASDIETFRPDAIEINSTNIVRTDHMKVRQLAERTGIRPMSNSDAHVLYEMGLYYNEIPYLPETEVGLAELLRKGGFACRSMPDRIEAYNTQVRIREEHIRRFLAEGRDSAYFTLNTGDPAHLFDQVAMGKTFEI
jgi:histidinol phosphatase-like PHP family hydrolase